MSDQIDSDNDDGDQTDSPNFRQLRQQLKDAQAEAAAAKAQAAEAEASKRENVFLKAGIDPEDPKSKYFYKGYDGELTAEAIDAAAVEAGLKTPPVPAQELQTHAAIDNAAVGGQAVGTSSEAELINLLNSAKSAEEYDQILATKGLLHSDNA